MSNPTSPSDARLGRRALRGLAAAIALAAAPYAGTAATDISTVPLPTYSVGGSVDIKPNILMVLDDSGSMDWNYLPDWANDRPSNHSSLPDYLFRNASFNGVAYNPAVTYSPPVTFTSGGAKDTGSYPSMTGASSSTGANWSSKPNWNAVPNDGFGIQSSSTSGLVDNAYFYTTVPGEYCDSPALTNCTTTSSATGNYQYPAPLRWCSDAQLTTCRALQDSTYKYPRMTAPRMSTITLSSASNASITGVTVDGLQILSGSTGSSSFTSTVASRMATNIRDCSSAISGNCGVVGYYAVSSGNTVYIFAPGTSTATPSVSWSGSLSVSSGSFAKSTVPLAPYASGTVSTATLQGENLRTAITSTINSYPYPGTNAKAATRTDCAGTTCTYQEEMTNYANWYAYYRTRMQMMKTSTSRAFAALDSDSDIAAGTTRYRVGFMSINNNTSSDFVNITDFDGAQKFAWFSKLFAAVPNNSTPLRQALSQAGRLYGGKYNGSSFNGSIVTDPLQYSCQKNFTILSTDGFWNGNGGKKLDGSTDIGNEDALLNRPYSDGTAVQIQAKTSTLQMATPTTTGEKGTLQSQTSLTEKRTAQLQKLESQLQTQTSQLQSLTSQLQANTSTLQTRTATLQTRTATLQTQSWTLQVQTTPVLIRTGTARTTFASGFTRQKRTSSNSGATWTDWANAGSCSVDSNGPTRTDCRFVQFTGPGSSGNQYFATAPGGTCTENLANNGPVTECAYGTPSGYSNASTTCVAYPADTSGTYNTAVDCQYTGSGLVNATSACTPVARSAGPTTYSVLSARDCQYTAFTSFTNATSACTAAAANNANLVARDCQYTAFTAYANATSACTPAAADNTNLTARDCQYTAYTGFANASSCNAAARSASAPYSTLVAADCQYVDGSWTNAASCNAQAKSTGPTYTVGTAMQCQYLAYTAWSNVSSCTAAAQSTGPGYTVGVARNCQYADTTAAPVNTSSCQPVAKSAGPTSYTVGLARACSYAAFSAYAPSNGTCTNAQSSGTGNWTVSTAIDCRTTVTTPFADAGSCSVTTVPNASGLTTQCQYSFAASAPVAGAVNGSCSPTYAVNNYTNATVYRNCSTTAPIYNNVSACNATTTTDVNGQRVLCQYTAYTAWANVAACTALGQSSGPNYTVGTATQCQTLTSGGNSNTLADVAAYYYYTDLRSATATGANASGTCTGPIIAPATTANDLCADNVPTYGRDTNTKQHMTTHTLGLGAQGNMVYSNYQNNVAGQRVYIPDYWSQASGDFYSVANGSTANPASGVCPWLSSGNCTWPTPSSDSIANIDDLWHAAINGHGTYFSATDPSSLADALKSVLSQITNVPRPGTAAAAASSNPNITSSDNYVFSSSYKSVDWYGELIMQRFNSDGSLTDQQWSAMRLLDCSASAWVANTTYYEGQTYQYGSNCYVVGSDYTSGATFGATDTGAATAISGVQPFTRTVYTVGSGGTLVNFAWANLSATQQAYFQQPYINGLSQFCSVGAACMSATSQASAAGQALVSFLAGDRSNEGSYFRSRKHVLGDIVSSEARYVKTPLQNYADTGYADYKVLHANRLPTVYVGANDGMVHAFNALDGSERWAFVPSAILPQMYKLADSDYSNRHQFMVDGSPEVGDVCPNAPGSTCAASQWRTILVGGFNDGAQAYYALDVTNPAAPALLWEFDNSASKANGGLGYSYSNPRITKLRDGTWVVMVASGYNNADGIGRLFVINAYTGALIRTIATSAGTAANPSGLAKLSARTTTGSTNNTAEQVYGGDLYGNVWRFDVNDTIGPSGYEAFKLVQLVDASGTPQPITAKPTVASVNNYPLVMVGTGKYLGLSDLTDTGTYTMYGIKDTLDNTTLANPRTSGAFVQQVMTDGTCPSDAPSTICAQGQTVRTSTSNPVDWSTKSGWYVDFIIASERSVTDPTLALGTLVFTTLKPQSSTSGSVIGCTADNTSINAKSYLYYLDYLTGGAVDGTKSVSGEELCTCYATRPSVVKDEQGNVEGIIRTSGGGVSTGTDMGVTNRQNLPYNAGGGSTRRISWRQLNGE